MCFRPLGVHFCWNLNLWNFWEFDKNCLWYQNVAISKWVLCSPQFQQVSFSWLPLHSIMLCCRNSFFLLGANTYLSPNKMADTDNLNPTPEINLDNTYSYLLEVGVIQQLKCYFLCISHQIFSGLGGVMINPLHVLKYLVPTKSIQYSTQIIHNTWVWKAQVGITPIHVYRFYTQPSVEITPIITPIQNLDFIFRIIFVIMVRQV